MKNKIVYLMTVFTLSIFGCKSQEAVSGFTLKYEKGEKELPLFTLPLVTAKRKDSYSGAFVQVIHNNGRRLDLFVPVERKGEVNISKVIKKIKSNNNPNVWGFYYAPFGVFNIDSIRFNDVVKPYSNYETIIEQNKLYNFDEIHENGYDIRIQYVDYATFCVVEASTHEVNNYNLRDKLQDGPKKRKSKIPTYLFSKDIDKVTFLLPASTFCE